MARNSLSPGYLKVFYTSNGHPHIQVLPVNPVAPAGAGTNLIDSGGSSQLWTSAVADLALIMKPFFHTTSSIDTAEIWTQATPTSIPLFQASTTVAVSGTATPPDIPFSQVRFSFRTTAGGKAVYQLMETRFTIDQKLSAPLYGGAAELQAVDSYLTGSSCVVWGRDNHYISSGIRYVSKINDGLRKKYLNP